MCCIVGFVEFDVVVVVFFDVEIDGEFVCVIENEREFVFFFEEYLIVWYLEGWCDC